MQPEAHSDFAMDQTWPPVASSASNPNTTPQRKLKIYAIKSPLSVPLRIRFGMVGCDVLRNTSKDWAVVDGIAAMAENAGALCDVFPAPWHPSSLSDSGFDVGWRGRFGEVKGLAALDGLQARLRGGIRVASGACFAGAGSLGGRVRRG